MSPQLSKIQKIVQHEQEPSVSVSVVLPVTDRHHDVAKVYEAYAGVLRQSGYSFEFIVVVDGGNEDVSQSLRSLVDNGEPIQVVVLRRAFGEATLLSVGFEKCRADIIVTVPAHFQTEPAGLHEIMRLLYAGNDFVVGRRWPRKDFWFNRVQHAVFHGLAGLFTGVKVFHDMTCGLKGFKKQVIHDVQLYGDLYLFFPVLAYRRGYRVVEVAIPQHREDCRARVYPVGLYLTRLLDIVTLAFLVKFTRKPLRLFGSIGAVLFGAGFLISLMLTIERVLGATTLADRPLLILGVLLMVLGVQTGSIGLLGEIIIFTHARRMKEYTVHKILR